MGKPGNRADPPEFEQTGPLDEQSDTTADGHDGGGEPTEASGGGAGEGLPAVTVTILAHTADACWKVMSNGQRLELTDLEWRKELARILSRSG